MPDEDVDYEAITLRRCKTIRALIASHNRSVREHTATAYETMALLNRLDSAMDEVVKLHTAAVATSNPPVWVVIDDNGVGVYRNEFQARAEALPGSSIELVDLVGEPE